MTHVLLHPELSSYTPISLSTSCLVVHILCVLIALDVYCIDLGALYTTTLPEKDV